MCGIAGIRRYGDKPIEEIQIKQLLTGLEHRGNDATGIAMQRKDGEILVLKNDVQAWNFVKSKLYEDFMTEFLDDQIIQVILHTRAATKGIPRVNNNNHPMFAGKSAVVHNGVLHNDDYLFKDLDLKREAETDSDIIRAIVDKYGITREAIRKLNRMTGSCATAALHPEFPGKMLLGRSGSPLTTGSTPDYFVFASEKNVIHRAMRPWIKRFGKWWQLQSLDMGFSPYQDDTIEILGEEGQEWRDAFKVHYGQYNEPHRRVYSGYQERQRKWTQQGGGRARGEAGTTALSSNNPVATGSVPTSAIVATKTEPGQDDGIHVTCPKCQKKLFIDPEKQRLALWQLCCPEKHGGCGTPLGTRVN